MPPSGRWARGKLCVDPTVNLTPRSGPEVKNYEKKPKITLRRGSKSKHLKIDYLQQCSAAATRWCCPFPRCSIRRWPSSSSSVSMLFDFLYCDFWCLECLLSPLNLWFRRAKTMRYLKSLTNENSQLGNLRITSLKIKEKRKLRYRRHIF